MATTRQSSVPQPPKSTKVSKKVLVAISVGACPGCKPGKVHVHARAEDLVRNPVEHVAPVDAEEPHQMHQQDEEQPAAQPPPHPQEEPLDQPENATE